MIATCDDDRLHKISVAALHPNYTFIASLCKEKVKPNILGDVFQGASQHFWHLCLFSNCPFIPHKIFYRYRYIDIYLYLSFYFYIYIYMCV